MKKLLTIVALIFSFQARAFVFNTPWYDPTQSTIDSMYATYGKTATDGSADPWSFSWAHMNTVSATLSNGKVISAGNPTDYPFLSLIGYDQNGNVDSSFGSTGVRQITNPFVLSGIYEVKDLTPTSSGDIFITNNSGYRLNIIKTFSNGQIDTTYGIQGAFESNLFNTIVNPIKTFPLPGNKLIVLANGDSSALMVRINANGSLDTTFNQNGIKELSHIPEITGCIFSGTGHTFITYSDANWITRLTKIDLNGNVITSFGNSGNVLVDSSHSSYTIAIQNSGSIITGQNLGNGYKLKRFYANGSRDNSFNQTGFLTLDLVWSDKLNLNVFNQDSILIVGNNWGSGTMIFAKCDSSGSIIDTNNPCKVNLIYKNDHGFLTHSNIVNPTRFILTGSSFDSYVIERHKLVWNEPYIKTIHDSLCDSAVYYGKTYYTSGIYYDTIKTGPCDTVVKLDLTIMSITAFKSDTALHAVGDSNLWLTYRWYDINGNLLDSGQHFTPTQGGYYYCTGYLTQQWGWRHFPCTSYSDTLEWPVSKTLTINSCEPVTFNGKTYSLIGDYIDTVVNPNGMDTIYNIRLRHGSISYSLHISDSSIAVHPSNMNYQWIQCSNDSVIPGAKSYKFEPLMSGNYKVAIQQGFCLDTSACHYVKAKKITGVIGHNKEDELRIFPNPFNSILNIDLSSIRSQEFEFSLFDSRGVLVMHSQQAVPNSGIFSFENSNLPSGIYLYNIIAENQIYTGRVIKK